MKAPTPKHQSIFASRFSPKEWEFLCSNEVFVDAVQCNLKRAWILSIRLLAEFYSVHRFARNEINSLRERLLSVGMNDSQIAAHLQAAAAELITQLWASQLNGDDDDVVVTE